MQITKRWLCTGAIAVAVGALPGRVGAQNNAAIDAGKRLFQGMCVECHGAGGAGGDLGPDLTDIGFLRGAAYLREAVVDPGSSLPKGTLSVLSRGYAEYLPVRIVTRQGSEVGGIRVNEDAFTIQVRDAAGKF